MNRIEIDPRDIDRVKLRVTGDNNIVIVKKLSDETVGKVLISLAGNDCSIILDAGINIGEALNIFAGQIHPNFGMINNTHIYVGKGTSFEKTTIATANANSSIEIGERCMFSYGITVYNTDSHPIIDAASGNIINKVKQLKIGDHVWVGANATILKNTHIPDDCIVGWGAVVYVAKGKNKTESHGIVATVAKVGAKAGGSARWTADLTIPLALVGIAAPTGDRAVKFDVFRANRNVHPREMLFEERLVASGYTPNNYNYGVPDTWADGVMTRAGGPARRVEGPSRGARVNLFANADFDVPGRGWSPCGKTAYQETMAMSGEWIYPACIGSEIYWHGILDYDSRDNRKCTSGW